MTQREVEDHWTRGLEASGIPVARAGVARPRPRLSFAAPVPTGILADREPLELLLVERLTIADLRRRLLSALPPGHEIVDLHDVWLGEAPLAGRGRAADYRASVDADRALLEPVVRAMLDAPRIERTRSKGDREKTIDLRPMLLSLSVECEGAGSCLRMRLRHDPELGNGRPADVIAEVESRLGRPLGLREIVRERVLLTGEDPDATPPAVRVGSQAR